jgi:hypothetical protein
MKRDPEECIRYKCRHQMSGADEKFTIDVCQIECVKHDINDCLLFLQGRNSSIKNNSIGQTECADCIAHTGVPEQCPWRLEMLMERQK